MLEAPAAATDHVERALFVLAQDQGSGIPRQPAILSARVKGF